MAYYPNYYGQQPYPYQDQLSQLRNTPMAMPGQTFQPPMPQYKPDNSGVLWVQRTVSLRTGTAEEPLSGFRTALTERTVSVTMDVHINSKER